MNTQKTYQPGQTVRVLDGGVNKWIDAEIISGPHGSSSWYFVKTEYGRTEIHFPAQIRGVQR